jgi:hypothetical protein
MNRQHVKTFLATFLASVLLYYSAAWAVLRCCPDEEHASFEESLSKDYLHDGLYSHLSWPSHAPTQIDCLDFEYHTEILAGPVSPPQFHRVTAAVRPSGNDFFVLKGLADSHKKNLLRNVFTRGSPPSELSDPPRYLSLSSLRTPLTGREKEVLSV